MDYCSGNGCPIKEGCHRFNQPKPNHFYWETTPPFTINNGIFSCSLFMGQKQTNVNIVLDKIQEWLKQHK